VLRRVRHSRGRRGWACKRTRKRQDRQIELHGSIVPLEPKSQTSKNVFRNRPPQYITPDVRQRLFSENLRLSFFRGDCHQDRAGVAPSCACGEMRFVSRTGRCVSRTNRPVRKSMQCVQSLPQSGQSLLQGAAADADVITVGRLRAGS
jgi:hypothetical protein